VSSGIDIVSGKRGSVGECGLPKSSARVDASLVSPERLAELLVRVAGARAVELVEHALQLSIQDRLEQRHGLSQRECEVLALVASGLSNREIAAALYIGEQTVKAHLRSIFPKLGVKNRTQAAIAARADSTPVMRSLR
jgi:DNA-binding NarL/FixJ family response regulator